MARLGVAEAGKEKQEALFRDLDADVEERRRRPLLVVLHIELHA